MDYKQARFNMIEQQIRPWEVLDPTVLHLLERLPREDFVPESARALAFADLEIPLGHGQHMLTPKLEARLLQALALTGKESVYEVGTGSGYFTALLAALARQVVSSDVHGAFIESARRKLKAAGIGNVHFKEGDAAREPLGHDNYDVIVLTGSTPVLSPRFLERLVNCGRLIAVEGHAPAMQAVLYCKDAQGAVLRTPLFETVVPPLINAPTAPRFSF
jgi:protein-L-isoaspartate(D-aspartate) O-methyltransferase